MIKIINSISDPNIILIINTNKNEEKVINGIPEFDQNANTFADKYNLNMNHVDLLNLSNQDEISIIKFLEDCLTAKLKTKRKTSNKKSNNSLTTPECQMVGLKISNILGDLIAKTEIKGRKTTMETKETKDVVEYGEDCERIENPENSIKSFSISVINTEIINNDISSSNTNINITKNDLRCNDYSSNASFKKDSDKKVEKCLIF